ncbi:disulfide bond formation protein B [Methylobacterium variabile]|jgi:disulfide bond formation protein DsbB|uniref:Disulfide bond formation protein B n=1 Tax=Methylobacterium variabile TaxID=298794 RepID=A0A0J6SRL7_9HYPH|nr:disulfide bond formation protein B [Methylobacterium variabile]KMO36227.1 disulfide bond formation protein B [Methylobacterium variabile]
MTPAQARTLNALGLLGCCAVLLVAFWYQFRLGEVPCPLCLLQRAAFAAAGVGFALGLRFGPKPSHHAITILSAVAGAFISARQVALHIVPGTGSYGSTLFGLHFYTLALIAFIALVVAAAVLLLLDGTFGAEERTGNKGIGAFPRACLLLFLGVILANAVSTVAECGGGLCPDDPSGYQALDNWLRTRSDPS